MPRLPKPVFHRSFPIPDSDWISEIQYDGMNLVLDATLKNGARYRYRNVYLNTFGAVITAKSVGKAFNDLIKPKSHTKLRAKKSKSVAVPPRGYSGGFAFGGPVI